MLSSTDRLCALIEDVQSQFAALFVLFERVLALDPAADADRIEKTNAQMAVSIQGIQSRMSDLQPALEEWRGRRAAYPAGVNEFVDRFLAVLESGLIEALGQVQRRSADVAARRSQIQTAIEAMKQQRKGLTGYKPETRQSPKLFDSNV